LTQGAYAKAYLDGLDPHWKTATDLELIIKDTELNKKNKVHAAIREHSKGFRYGFLFGMGPPRAGHIIYNTARAVHHIDAGNDLQKKLFGKAAGADLDRIEIIKMMHDRDAKDGKPIRRMFSLITDLERLREKIIARGNVKLVEIDPVSAYLGLGKVDSYRTSDVRAILGPLKDLAEELAVAVIGIMHFNKKVDVTNVLLRVSDSLAFVAAPRHVFGVIDDPDNGRKLVVRAKNNLTDADQKKKSLAFHFDVKQVGVDPRNNKPIQAPFIVWNPGYVDVTATEALSAVNQNKAPGALDDAKEFLRDMLVAGGGRAPKADIEEAADAEKIAPITLRRAKKTLKIRAEKDRTTPEGRWYWVLPDDDGEGDQGV
jgi:hypothetical protein